MTTEGATGLSTGAARTSAAQADAEPDPSVAGHARALEVLLPLNAVAFPILPGKTDEWHKFVADLAGPRHEEFSESRRRVGVHERTFLQKTPMGDLAIVTIEGDDPGRSFRQMTNATDPFSVWFLDRVKTIHGIDLALPMDGSPSELVLDSEPVAVPV